MRWVVSLALIAGALGGCGASGGALSSPETASEDGDVGVQLASALPRSANRCSVSRPYLLPEARRGLFVRVSQADPLPWVPGAPIAAVASADRVAPDGRRSSVALVRTTVDPRTMRAWLRENAPVRVRLEDAAAPEPDATPAYAARFIDPHTLRLQLGAWPVTDHDPPGAEARCAALAGDFPEAVELSSRQGEVVILGAAAHLPRRTDVVLVADGTAVTVTRQITMASAEQAEDRRRELHELEPFAWSMMGDLYPDRVDHERRGNVLTSRLRILWDDLALAAQDQRRMVAAIAEDERRNEPQQPESIDVHDLAFARAQVALWTQRVASSRGARRRASAEQLRALLERVVDVHPTELEMARQLARLLIDELEDGRSAVAVIDRVLGGSPPEAESWRVLRREALAATGQDALADALVADGVVARADVARAASDLVALRRQGVDYEFAEGAWIAAQTVESRAGHLRLRDVPAARLPLDSFIESIGELADIGSGRHGPAAIYVLARGDRSDFRLLWNPDTSPVVEVGDASGARRLVGVASTGDERVRAMGRSIADGFLIGALELAIFVVPIGGSPSEPELVLRLAGTLETDAFVLSRASGGAARVDWREVSRLLAVPLAALEPRVFPPPELSIDVANEREGQRLVELSADLGTIHCGRAEHHVRCTSSPEAPRAARELLRLFARERLGGAARTLGQP